MFFLRYCPSSNSLCTKHDIFSSMKQKLLTVNYPDNKRRPLSRGGGLQSQLVGDYRRAVSTKYPICHCLKLRLVFTGNSRGGQIQLNSTFRSCTEPSLANETSTANVHYEQYRVFGNSYYKRPGLVEGTE